ncbi:Octamer-binding transcription factor [Parasponia andersonii]|uniref:Octamer-binding transcription factor n=1 Tax=Parasponia andersonii TaxID=3476 RepID=A0A2P5AI56_PARAD|nr:Octamer-binding transcription factor [Parasponia andersonii]
MDLSNHQEGDIPIPINSTAYGDGGHGHGHLIHHDTSTHNHIIPSSAIPQIPSNNGSSIPTSLEDHVPYNNKKVVKYRECLKNHAAAMGANATDGCGEFMPSGEEGTIEALKCSACNCHRNFHRKEIEGEPSSYDQFHHNSNTPHLSRMAAGRKFILGHNKGMLGPDSFGYPTATGAFIPSRTGPVPHHMIMSYNMGSLPSESDEQEDVGGGAGAGGGGVGSVACRPPQLVKKRFRTKFTQEQKEKMLNFAEKVGWKIQKQEESVVQQFCQEIGVKRRVLKVWMHNNKHNLAKKNAPSA